jgi:hypothetical protein
MSENKKILVISGKKQSGKTTLANYVKSKLDDCQIYSFATPVKESLINLFGLRREQCYGSNADKETTTEYLWENVPGLDKTQYAGRTGKIIARDMMKIWGTHILRKFDKDILAMAGYRQIEQGSLYSVGVLDDARFPNEIMMGYVRHAKLIRLTRNPFPDEVDESETSLDEDKFNWNLFDKIIKNHKMTEVESCKVMDKLLKKWKWL